MIMATRGQVMLIQDSHYYGFYQHNDMYPGGHPRRLFEEAAEISANDEWRDILLGFLTKSWVCEWEDRNLSRGKKNSIRTPQAPALMNHKPGNLVDDVPYEEKIRLRRAADMPIMCRELLWGESDTEYAVVIDLDVDRIVCVDTARFELLMCADLQDPEAIAGEAGRAEGVRNHHELRPLALEAWRPDISTLRNMTDETAPFTSGQWNRPPTFPEFHGAPDEYPAQPYKKDAVKRGRRSADESDDLR